MFAPVSIQDNSLPQQSLPYWSSFEAQQWMKAGLQLTTESFQYATASVRVGSDFGTQDFKWVGGAMAADGKIYAPAHFRNQFLIMDTVNRSVSTSNSTGSAWYGQSSTPDAITNIVYSSGGGVTGQGGWKIETGSIVPNKIAFSGRSTASPAQQGFVANNIFPWWPLRGGTGLYSYNIAADTLTLEYNTSAGTEILSTTLGINGKIFGAPSNTSLIYEYDPQTDTTASFGNITGNRYFNIKQYFDGWIYMLPNTTAAAIKINPLTREIVTLPNTTVAHGDITQIGGDGRLYSIVSGNTVRWYDPRTLTDGTLCTTADGLYISFTVGIDGALWFTPRSSRWVNYIPPVRGGEYYRGYINRRQGARYL